MAKTCEINELQRRATQRAYPYIPKGYGQAQKILHFPSVTRTVVDENLTEHVWGAWTYSDEQEDGLVKLWRRCYCLEHLDKPAEEIF